jgi:threonine dehydratase
MFTLSELESVLPVVRAAVSPTPQYAWPLLKARTGVDVWVKHENHTPIGTFKVRGGLVYFDRLRQQQPGVHGVISATRGNHGQSLAFAGQRLGLPVTIVVPQGNSTEKNASMRALGAELIEYGRDFDAAKQHAVEIAAVRGLNFAPTFHRDLVLGVATFAYELFTAVTHLDAVYVPIGLGSAICGVIATRDALGLKTEIVGVVSDRANAYQRSVKAGRVVCTHSALTFADGIAVRVPDATAFEVVRHGASRIVAVSDSEIADAIRIMFSDTHSTTEGAGAASLAALIKERDRLQGRRVAVIATGQNIDRRWMAKILAGGIPDVQTCVRAPGTTDSDPAVPAPVAAAAARK